VFKETEYGKLSLDICGECGRAELQVSGFQALGTLMAVGLMMLPAIAARHWARSVGGMAYAAVGIAALSAYAGLLMSFHADVPSGPAVVLAAGLCWLVSTVCGPVDGLLGRLLHRPHLAG